jgi:sec-independent protein translocase protein TatB
MEILGIGPLELVFILIIALIILGPGDMVKAGRMLGRMMRKVVTSPEWRTVQKASRELKYLPNRLMREASLEDLTKDFDDLNKIGKDLHNDVRQVQSDLSSWTTPPELMNMDEIVPEPSSDVNPSPVSDNSSKIALSPEPDPSPEGANSLATEPLNNPDPENKTD